MRQFFAVTHYPKWIAFRHHNLWKLNEKVPKIEGSVCENTNDWDCKSLIQSFDSVLSDDLFTTIKKAVELSFSFWLSDISSKSGSCEVKRINEDQTEATSNTSWCQRSDEILSFVGNGINSFQEDSVNGILGREVNGLSGEVSENVCPVTSPEWRDSFFSDASLETVNDTFVWSFFEFGVILLGLKKKFDSFNGCSECFGNGSWSTADGEIF